MKILSPYTGVSYVDKFLQDKHVNGTQMEDLILVDHIAGFDINRRSPVLDVLNQKAKHANKVLRVKWHNVLEQEVTDNYENLLLEFDTALQEELNFASLKEYTIHPNIEFKNFVCCFNGTRTSSRVLLTSCLEKFSWFDPEYCSKNFLFDVDSPDGIVEEFVGDQQRFYNKFFSKTQHFAESVYGFDFDRFNHLKNVNVLESKLTQSFINIASESLADKYCPFVSEKFLYSVVTRGLFLAWAQPGWHAHLEKYYGFKRYTKLFDYSFDLIENPVERIVALMTMIGKFSALTTDDWKDLHDMESDTIEYNYNHYFSNDYLKTMQTYQGNK